jgi:hypothetical protein
VLYGLVIAFGLNFLHCRRLAFFTSYWAGRFYVSLNIGIGVQGHENKKKVHEKKRQTTKMQ